MSGRFFAAPMLASCMLLAATARHWKAWCLVPLWTAILLAGGLPATSNLRSGADCGLHRTPEQAFDLHGIADERGFYYPSLGLLRGDRETVFPVREWRQQAQQDRALAAEWPLVLCGNIGVRCYYGGPAIHYIDHLGLGDPLLARLPTRDPDHWRIGHFERLLPNGYAETLASGENHLEDARYAIYYDRLKLITRGDLFDRRRLRELWRMLRGRYDGLLEGQPPVPPATESSQDVLRGGRAWYR
jgi:arabinofuranosyltransferase